MVLVISPLRSLMINQREKARAMGLKCVAVIADCMTENDVTGMYYYPRLL